MRVAFLSTEVVPFAKTGGLADVAGALPKALRKLGVDALIVLPLYRQIDRNQLTAEVIENLAVEWRGHTRLTRVFQSDAAGAPAYLIDAPEYFSRPSIYGHSDDHERFAFLGRAALSLLRHLEWPPDIVHANDWPGGFPTIELRARRRFDPFFRNTRTVFSIHNLAYQGRFDPADIWWLGDRKSTRLNSSHAPTSYAIFSLT